ncbi:anthranilate synthase component I family protein [Alkalihalobacterium bogoriense]|uniref:anthranilate synthase component I family protein n=1 Tax=Alkalihalobacterium bogoriense TaxID=246272 RepID=UPI000478C341|nr:anthranilate synthase component I family protein [Alkalihalobacterium bogoriense]
MTTTIAIPREQWFRAYQYLGKEESHHVLLESGRGGQFSIIGLRPFAIVKGKDKQFSVTIKEKTTVEEGTPFTLLQEWMDRYSTPLIEDGPPFQGGAIGYISYDMVRHFEKLDNRTADDLQTYDFYFLVFDDVFVYEPEKEILTMITHYTEGSHLEAKTRLERYKKQWEAKYPNIIWERKETPTKQRSAGASFTEEEFTNAVSKIQEYIAQGDVFQVNLSVRQESPLVTDPFHIYEKLRELNPSPYMAYLHSDEFQIVSGSPELLVKKKGNDISTRPIAGTRSRGMNEDEDERLAKTLIENEKERAEHIMLVDLERNDLGRVCAYGTVEVDELMVIEKYSHVMHIVSNVRGTLAEGKSGYEVIEATFPGGTITGAPKVRTMEIIEELEPVRRGIYTGSIGWIGFNGDLELNIVIRTLLAKDGIAYVQAGAGIVIDSDPKAEYKESLKKARALWKAKEMSEEETVDELRRK